MKKVAPLILGIFYLFASLGIAATVHYCGNKVADVSLAVVNNKSCCCGPSEATTKCCSDKIIAFEIPADDYLPSKIVSLVNFSPIDTNLITKTPFLLKNTNTPISFDWLADLPPGKSKRIDICSLIFYS
jgi:hypothetical protein